MLTSFPKKQWGKERGGRGHLTFTLLTSLCSAELADVGGNWDSLQRCSRLGTGPPSHTKPMTREGEGQGDRESIKSGTVKVDTGSQGTFLFHWVFIILLRWLWFIRLYAIQRYFSIFKKESSSPIWCSNSTSGMSFVGYVHSSIIHVSIHKPKVVAIQVLTDEWISKI